MLKDNKGRRLGHAHADRRRGRRGSARAHPHGYPREARPQTDVPADPDVVAGASKTTVPGVTVAKLMAVYGDQRPQVRQRAADVRIRGDITGKKTGRCNGFLTSPARGPSVHGPHFFRRLRGACREGMPTSLCSGRFSLAQVRPGLPPPVRRSSSGRPRRVPPRAKEMPTQVHLVAQKTIPQSKKHRPRCTTA